MTWVRWNAKNPSLRRYNTKTRWHLVSHGVIACNIVRSPYSEGVEYTDRPEPALRCSICERIVKREMSR